MSKPREESHDTIIGRLVIEKGLATKGEVKDCEHMHKDLKGRAAEQSMAEILVSSGIITSSQLQRIWSLMEERQSENKIPGYQIHSKLGTGAMATVYKGTQISLQRTVAIKILPQAKNRDPDFVKRFYEEGRIAAKLNHSNIVQAYDVGQAGDYHYFVMEYVEGHTVFDHLNTKGKYTEPEALKIMLQVTEALNHAHQTGLIHRDVKPKNIMINKDGVAKLADMGLARMVTDAQAAEAEAGRAYGTPYYISPEQVRGERDIDFRADIYGLGATLYLMLTGKVPFDAPTPSGVMLKHLREQLVPPDRINPKLSSGICDIIEMMMSKSRDQRYGSTAELLQDFKAVAAGESPIYARKSINLSELSSIENNANPLPDDNMIISHTGLLEQPLFWVALLSGILNIILIFLLMNR